MAKEIIMPKFGFTQEVGRVVAWLKREGDYVEAGDPIMEVETDKVVMEIEAPASGYLAGLRAAAGDEVPVTQVIGYIVAEGEQLPTAGAEALAADATPPDADDAPVKATPLAQRIAQAESVDLSGVVGTGPQGRVTKRDVEQALAAASAVVKANGKQRATPAARRVAREQGIDLQQVSGSGPRQRVQVRDVMALAQAVRQPAPVPAPPPTPAPQAAPEPPPSAEAAYSGERRVPFNSMRRAIARNLQASWQAAPHIFFTADADLSAAQRLVQLANERAAEGEKVTLTAAILKATAWALTRHPSVNSHIDGEAKSSSLRTSPRRSSRFGERPSCAGNSAR
jgi:pyruvate dehydrogenase E2 component (dihydrolipoamide acetyltransferase)